MRNQLFVLPLLEFIETNYAGHEELGELARIARQTHDRLNELLDDVRSFARKEDETCRKSPVNLAQVVREAVSLASMHPSVPKQGLKLQVQAEPTVVCHAIRIQQVIFNLVRNAADALKAQPCPKILVTLAEDGDRISLSVQDNGPGLDPAQLERVGEAFFTTKGGEGTGLGLDICRRIVSGHGGTLTCQSQPGQGATFIVRLPRTPPAAAAERWTSRQAAAVPIQRLEP
jgi:signal transduction histidine kinase